MESLYIHCFYRDTNYCRCQYLDNVARNLITDELIRTVFNLPEGEDFKAVWGDCEFKELFGYSDGCGKVHEVDGFFDENADNALEIISSAIGVLGVNGVRGALGVWLDERLDIMYRSDEYGDNEMAIISGMAKLLKIKDFHIFI